MNDRGLSSPLSFHGRVEVRTVDSALLAGNRAGDPHRRELWVYLPPRAREEARRWPCVWLLPAFTARPAGLAETHPWKRGALARFDAALASGITAPAIVVVPDCFTCLGGSQYVNSSFLGPYEDHLIEELVPFVDENYPTLPGARAVAGKSSGGFGALRLGQRHPDLFGAVASISGDCAFEVSLAGELLACLRGLVPFGGDPARFLEAFRGQPDLSGDGHAVLNVLAMAACYSPNPDAPLGFDLPMDLHTGERIPEVWQRWLAFDPLLAVARAAPSLKRLSCLHVECGLRDEFHLQWGARQLHAALQRAGVPHDYEEHPGGHRGLDERLARVLPKLVRAVEARAAPQG